MRRCSTRQANKSTTYEKVGNAYNIKRLLQPFWSEIAVPVFCNYNISTKGWKLLPRIEYVYWSIKKDMKKLL